MRRTYEMPEARVFALPPQDILTLSEGTDELGKSQLVGWTDIPFV